MAIRIEFTKMLELLLMIKSECEEQSGLLLKGVSEEERKAYYERINKRYKEYAVELNDELHIEEDDEN